jgi:hypothetical protein
MTDDERQLARERVAAWPVEDRRALVGLERREIETIALLVALLDLRPHEPRT